ncbi:hypothetical protein IX317_001713 [Fusobacterium sp. DD29]|uniref:YadA-like family protein n=1 Tax=unclassified Fusobacterium TaxID=2648384 RepID=UPI001B8D5BFA|nr:MULTISPECIES: YadA-like family protein [unclassified Fusobacterium]MBR8750032.1 hypothetical protein [Fusobacterium sp. DD29]MBR8762274.1 hypothetical protein [Fusobacterium sp. DD25]MBR8768296.1 hypothetical protein [Fusobacterium sp. DD43]MBR8772367.1 hypothetical protein [Fusobacterium sp. DD40]MBR8776586.1 hypothetical protein [Fusobacterium sp. DD17]
MTKSMHDEKWVKRWLKRTISITLGVVVGVLINGGVVFAQDTASLEATVRAQQEQINALIKEVNALKNELSTREQVAAKKVRSVEVTPMGVTATVTGDENTSVALSGVDTITGVGPVTVSTNGKSADISLKNEFTYGNIGMNFNAGEIKTKKLIVDGKSITEQFNELVLPIGINGTGANVKLNGGRLSFNAGDGIGIYGDGEGGMTIASTFKPATRLQIGIDSTGADVDLINGRLHFISENGITMHGNGSGNVNIGLTDNIELGKLKLQGPNGIIHLGDDTILESSHFKVGKMDFNGKEAGSGINMNGLPLTGLKDAAVDGDAVNYGQFRLAKEQLDSAQTNLNLIKNFKYSGDEGTGTMELGKEATFFNIKGDGNAISTVASNDGVNVKLNNQFKIGNITVDAKDSQNKIEADNLDIHIKKGKIVFDDIFAVNNSEIYLNSKQIHSVAPGERASDVATVGQLESDIPVYINSPTSPGMFKTFKFKEPGKDNRLNIGFENGLTGHFGPEDNQVIFSLSSQLEMLDSEKRKQIVIESDMDPVIDFPLHGIKMTKEGFEIAQGTEDDRGFRVGGTTLKDSKLSMSWNGVQIEKDKINMNNCNIEKLRDGTKDSDAVNLKQLKEVKEEMSKGNKFQFVTDDGEGSFDIPTEKFTIVGDDAVILTKVDPTTKKVSINVKESFQKGKLTVNTGDNGYIQFGNASSKTYIDDSKISVGDIILDSKQKKIQMGDNYISKDGAKLLYVKIGSQGIVLNGERKLTGLKGGENSNDAATYGQLQSMDAIFNTRCTGLSNQIGEVNTKIQTGVTLRNTAGEEVNVTLGDKLNIDSGEIIESVFDNNDKKLSFNLKSEFKIPDKNNETGITVNTKEPAIGIGTDVKMNKAGLSVYGATINDKGLDMNGKAVKNVADPTDDADAVNLRRLKTTEGKITNLETNINNKISTVENLGYKVDAGVENKVSLASGVLGIKGDMNTVETSLYDNGDVKIGLKDKIIKNNFTLDSNSGTIELKNSIGTAKLTPTSLEFGQVKIENSGINAGNVSIGEVGAGVKPNDAVNKGQLDIVEGIAKNAKEFANKGWYYKTDSNMSNVLDDDNVIKPGETFNVVGSGAIRTLAKKIEDGAEKGKKQLVIEVRNEFKDGKFEVNKENGEIKIGSVSLSDKGLTIAHSEGLAYETVISPTDIKFGGKRVQRVGAAVEDDDAVNLGQLKGQITRIDNNERSITSNRTDINKNAVLIEQNSKLKYEGDTNKGEMPIATGTLAIKGSGGIVTVADDQNKGHITIGLKNKFEVGSLNFDGTDGKIYIGNCSFGVDGLKVGVVELKNESKNEAGEKVPQILDMHGVKITGLPDGKKDDDAVNYGQLSKVDAKANSALKGWKYKTDTIGTGVDTVIKPEGTFTIKGDGKTIKTSSLNNGTVEVGLKDEFKLNNMSVDTKTATFVFETKDETIPKSYKTQLSSKGVDIGDTHLTETGLKVGNIEIAQNGINASDNKITGLKAGENDGEAVNFEQLKEVKTSLASTDEKLAKGWNYAADNTGAGEEKSIKHGDTLRINGSEAIKTSIDTGAPGTENSVKIALKDKFTVNNMSVDTKVGELKFTGKETDAEGHTVQFETLLNSKGITAGGVSLTHSGINAGGNKITGVGKGVADTDAANVGQLKKIKDLVESNKTETDKTENVVANRKLKYGDGVNKHEIKLAEGALLVEGIGPIKTTATELGEDHDGKIQIGIKDKFTVNNMDVDTIDATLVMETEEGSGTAAKTYKTQLSSKGLDIGDTHLTEKGLTVGKIQIAQNGINLGDNKITGLKAGERDDDAVNVGQLKATEKIVTDTQSLLNKGWKYAADTVGGGVDNVIKPDGTFTIKGDGNAIKTSSTENGAVSIGLEKKFKVEKFDVDMDSGTLVLGETGGKTIYDPKGVKAGGVSLTHSGIDAGNKQIANVAEGTKPLDAVNFSQLEGISEKVENNKIFKYQGNDGTGQIDLSEGRPLAILGGKAIKTHTETTVDSRGEVNHRLIVELREQFTTSLMGVDADKGVIAIGKVTQDKDGNDIQEDAVIHDGDGIHVGRNISITKENGINAGEKTITKVAAGVLDDDAVNKAQLDKVSTALAETNETVAKGWNYAADDTTPGEEKNIQHGDTLKIKGSEAIETSIDNGTENGVKVALKDKFRVKNMDIDADKGELILSSEVTDSAGRKDKLSSTFSSKGVEVGDSHLTKDGLSVGNVKVAASGIDAGKHRITKVADGIDEEDAVNKKQLNIVDAKVNKNTTDISNLALNYAGDTGTGKVKLTDTFAVNGDGNVVTKVASPNRGIEISLGDDINLGTKVEIKGDTGFYIKDANVSVTDAGFKAGDILMSSTGLTAGGVSVGADGINAGSKKITGVATGTIATDAVNYGQLQKVEKDLTETTAILNKGWKYAADGTVLGSEGVIKPGDTLSIKGSKAIKTSIDIETPEKNIVIALKDKFIVKNMDVDAGKGQLILSSTVTDTAGTETNFKSTFSSTGVLVGNSHLTKDGLSVGNVKVTNEGLVAGNVFVKNSGINAGNQKITGVADGGETATDAVNYGQLKKVEKDLGETLNKGWHYAADSTGVRDENTIKPGDTLKIKGSDAIETSIDKGAAGTENNVVIALKDKFTVKNMDVDADRGELILSSTVTDSEGVKTNFSSTFSSKGVVVGDSHLTKDGLSVGNVKVTNEGLIAGNVFVKDSGINADGKKITKVADGTIATDAVNYGQLQKVEQDLVNTTETLKQGWNYAADSTRVGDKNIIKPGNTLKIKGSDAIETSIDNGADGKEHNVVIALKDNFKLNKMDVDTNVGSIVLRDERTIAGTEDKEIFQTTLKPDGVQVGTVKMTKDGIDAGNRNITNVARGTKDEHAVNLAQLNEVSQKVKTNTAEIKANSKLNYSADENLGSIELKSGALAVKGDPNGIITKVNSSGQVIIGLRDEVKIGDTLSLDGKIGKISLNNSNVTIDSDGFKTGSVSVGVGGIDAGNNRITKVLAGEHPLDAVNVTQLNKIEAKINSTSQEVSQNTTLKVAGNEDNKDIKLATDVLNIKGGDQGIIFTKAYEHTTETSTEKGIEIGIKDQFVLGKLTVNAKDGILHIGGHDWTLSNQGLNMGKVKVLKAGISAGEKKITGVAAGQAGTDAVNMNQLDEVKGQIQTTDDRISDVANKGVVIAGNDQVNIKKGLGEALIIRGNDVGQVSDITANYTPDNIATYNDGNQLRIVMAKAPKFESININGVKLSSNRGGRMTVVNLSDSGQPVELRGIAPGTSADSVVTKEQFDEAINKNSAAVEGISLKYAGNTAETVGKDYKMNLKTDTLTIKGNENSKNIVTTTKNNGTIELDLGDTVTIGKPGSEVKIDGTAGTVTTGNTVIAKDKVQVGDVTIKDNKISGLADGVDDHDAATVGQLNAMKNTVIGDAADAALGKIKVNYEGNSTSKKDVPLANGEINVVVKGESKNRTDGTNIVSSVKSNGEIDLDLDKKVVIGKGANQITINGDDTDPDGGAIKVGITEIKKDAIDVELDTGEKVVINNMGINAGHSAITNVADGVNDHDAVNVKQLKELSSMVTSSSTIVKGSGAAIVTPVTEEGHKGYNVHVDKVVQFTDKDGRDVVKVGNNFHIVKNGVVSSTTIAAKDIYTRMVNPDGTTTTPTKLGNVAPGKVAPGSTDAVNGSQLYETQQMIVNNNGLAQQNARQIRELRSDLNNGMAQMAAMSSVEFTGVAPHKMRVAAGIGAYRGARAVAVGVGYSPQEAFLINAKWSTPTNTCRGSAVGIGASYEFNFD